LGAFLLVGFHSTGNASNIRQLFGEIDSGMGLQELIRLM
jgi:hypothetical protein